MIQPESTTTLQGFSTDNGSIGGMSKSSTRNYERSRENTFITNTIINGGKWVFLSNRIVGYWPFAIETSSESRQKYLSFQLPTFGLFVTVFHFLLNVSYLVNFLLFKLEFEASLTHPFDLLSLILSESIIFSVTTACRLYGIWRLKKIHSFWNSIVNIVIQFTEITSEGETEQKFREINNWGFKWIAGFTIIGIINASASFLNNFFFNKDPLNSVMSELYIGTVICSHNSSAFLLIFFIKIMTHGFTICRRKLEQLATQTGECETQRESYCGGNTLSNILTLIYNLEKCVASFNHTFIFSLFMEASFSFLQIMFAMNSFIVVNPFSHVLNGVVTTMRFLSYSVSLVYLCITSSKLTVECQEMTGAFQELQLSKLSAEQGHKVQLMVTRLTSEPLGIQVSQLFQIRESLLGSTLNTLATYFIVLVQMRQIALSNDPIVEEN